MMMNFSIHYVFVSVINAIAVWLAAFIFFRSQSQLIRKNFIFLVFSMLLWVNSAFLSRILSNTSLKISYYFIVFAWGVTPLFFYFSFRFVYSLLEKRYEILGKLVLVSSLVATAIVFLPEAVIHSVLISQNAFSLAYGDWLYIFLSLILFIAIATIFICIRLFSNRYKEQAIFISIGYCIFLFINIIFNIYLPIFMNNSSLYYIGDYSLLLLLIFFSSSLYRSNIFGLRLFLYEFAMILFGIVLTIFVVFSQDPVELELRIILLGAYGVVAFLVMSHFLKEDKKKEIVVQQIRDLEILLRAQKRHSRGMKSLLHKMIMAQEYIQKTPSNEIDWREMEDVLKEYHVAMKSLDTYSSAISDKFF